LTKDQKTNIENSVILMYFRLWKVAATKGCNSR